MRPIVAIHSFPIWLPQTQTWMFYQIKHLSASVESRVVCERTQNLDQFAVEGLDCLWDESPFRAVWEAACRRLRLRLPGRYLAAVVRATNALIIHSHFGHIGWNDAPVAGATGARHIVTFYGADVNKLPTQDPRWLPRYAELFKTADAFLCEGPYMASELVRLGCPGSKVQVHHLGIETDKITYRPRRWSPGGPFRVLIAASFREKKGIPFALQALGELKKLVPLVITIIGDADSTADSRAEKRRILRALADARLERHTTFLGFQPYKRFLAEAYAHHALLSPSVTAANGDTEGGAPVTLTEAMASGMPVISTRHCDIPEVVDYGVSDWLVAERDAEGLLQRLLWLTENPESWGSLLQRGRVRAASQFDARKQGRKLEDVYRKVLAT